MTDKKKYRFYSFFPYLCMYAQDRREIESTNKTLQPDKVIHSTTYYGT